MRSLISDYCSNEVIVSWELPVPEKMLCTLIIEYYAVNISKN